MEDIPPRWRMTQGLEGDVIDGDGIGLRSGLGRRLTDECHGRQQPFPKGMASRIPVPSDSVAGAAFRFRPLLGLATTRCRSP